MSMYQKVLSETLSVSPERALLVEGYLRLQYGTLDHLSMEDFRREYTSGGISRSIDEDPALAADLAKSYGLM